ncbi:hypothetical protein ACQEVB_01350 [Pseudonocardia sp. CA-107938]|uniref:hypothetical protein n=1 Tax=Pseudonocardia sp. CA-107938 TaxID=3240021 RepID=UPI003D9463A0
MDLLGCNVCTLVGSGGVAVVGYLAGRCSTHRGGRRAADRRSRGRTMRSWPGGQSHGGRRGGPSRAAPGDGDDGTAGGEP